MLVRTTYYVNRLLRCTKKNGPSKKLQKAFELYHGTEKIYLDYVKTICLSIDTFINIKFDKNLIFEVQ